MKYLFLLILTSCATDNFEYSYNKYYNKFWLGCVNKTVKDKANEINFKNLRPIYEECARIEKNYYEYLKGIK